MRLAIKTLKGELFHVEAEPTDTVLNLKEKVQQDKPDFVVDKQKLIHAGKVLKDTQSIGELGIKDTDFIVCMVSKDAPAPKPKPAPTTTVTPPVTSQQPVQSSNPAPISAIPVAAPAPIQVNPEALQALVGMGFPESESRSALIAAMGNPDLAYEFLLNGIPEQALHAAHARQRVPVSNPSNPPPTGLTPGPLDQLRLHPQFNALKQLIQQNPAALPQVLNLIGDQNPQLLEAIHANNDAFVAMMNEPITETPAVSAPTSSNSLPSLGSGGPSPAQISTLLSSLPPEQRAQFAQSVGMTPEQLQAFMQIMSTIPPEQLSQMIPGLGNAGGNIPPGANVIRLNDEELQAVNRLQQLGFSQEQALQAYLACDKNEAMAANLLFDGGLGFDDDEGGGGDGYNGGDYDM